MLTKRPEREDRAARCTKGPGRFPARWAAVRFGLVVAAALSLSACASSHVSGRTDARLAPDMATDPMCIAADDCDATVRSGSGDNAPFLPWPPPAPSVAGELKDRFPLRGRLGQVAAQIDAKLKTRGYEKLYYYAAPGGFAVTTEVERIGPDGAPDANRWLIGKLGGWSSVWSYVTSLVGGESQRYRLAVVVVTNEEVQPATFRATNADTLRWQAAGRLSLSAIRSGMRVEPDTKVWLLVYEFVGDKSKGGRLVAIEDGSLPFSAHARALGLK